MQACDGLSLMQDKATNSRTSGAKWVKTKTFSGKFLLRDLMGKIGSNVRILYLCDLDEEKMSGTLINHRIRFKKFGPFLADIAKSGEHVHTQREHDRVIHLCAKTRPSLRRMKKVNHAQPPLQKTPPKKFLAALIFVLRDSNRAPRCEESHKTYDQKNNDQN